MSQCRCVLLNVLRDITKLFMLKNKIQHKAGLRILQVIVLSPFIIQSCWSTNEKEKNEKANDAGKTVTAPTYRALHEYLGSRYLPEEHAGRSGWNPRSRDSYQRDDNQGRGKAESPLWADGKHDNLRGREHYPRERDDYSLGKGYSQEYPGREDLQDNSLYQDGDQSYYPMRGDGQRRFGNPVLDQEGSIMRQNVARPQLTDPYSRVRSFPQNNLFDANNQGYQPMRQGDQSAGHNFQPFRQDFRPNEQEYQSLNRYQPFGARYQPRQGYQLGEGYQPNEGYQQLGPGYQQLGPGYQPLGQHQGYQPLGQNYHPGQNYPTGQSYQPLGQGYQPVGQSYQPPVQGYEPTQQNHPFPQGHQPIGQNYQLTGYQSPRRFEPSPGLPMQLYPQGQAYQPNSFQPTSNQPSLQGYHPSNPAVDQGYQPMGFPGRQLPQHQRFQDTQGRQPWPSNVQPRILPQPSQTSNSSMS